MNEDLLAAINAIAESLRADVAKFGEQMNARYDSLDGELKRLKADAAKKRKDDDGEDDMMAQRTAADSVDDFRHEVRVLTSAVADLRKNQTRPISDLNKFADSQAKADAVMVALGSRAEPPMHAEHHTDYLIRLHRKMQPHSPRWKGVDLNLIARDPGALDGVCDQIRADAMASSTDTSGMKPLEHRKIVEAMPSGHVLTRFVGNGTFVKQLSRPVRHVAYIGTRN
ncbi:hypothetical protein [Bradyrhizobium japonicum]|uniref:hypothetical protein n=1 Tax=Bradyrhizobium japonicum TaxID=375 RepID=UPI00200FFDE9|nr:hypothetical protein [Bradyrhizobium japonicum]UQD95228.1 hypothetical protein JEY30_26775 [Bradyrhizobium japonicum]